MTSISFASLVVIGIISLLTSPIAINARPDESCKETTLYALTFPPGKAEHTILCHPVGKALTTANNANIQFNAGEMAAHNTNQTVCWNCIRS